MKFLVSLVLFLAMTDHSSATYCICKNGDQRYLQIAIDYACGAGADCSGILQNGACYNPNTPKDHCNYAVNSFFQRKSQVYGSCDFHGVAITSDTIPAQSPGCIYPTSSSNSSSPPDSNTGGPTGSEINNNAVGILVLKNTNLVLPFAVTTTMFLWFSCFSSSLMYWV